MRRCFSSCIKKFLSTKEYEPVPPFLVDELISIFLIESGIFLASQLQQSCPALHYARSIKPFLRMLSCAQEARIDRPAINNNFDNRMPAY